MRWENSANKQLQVWPTPEVFIKRGDSDLEDTVNSSLLLSAFVAVLPQIAPTQTDGGNCSPALTGFIVNGAQPSIQTDTGNSLVSLSVFVAIGPQTVTQSDSGNCLTGLSAFSAIGPQVAPAQSDAANSPVNLSAFVV